MGVCVFVGVCASHEELCGANINRNRGGDGHWELQFVSYVHLNSEVEA